MNPRYEKVNLCLKVKLLKGKDENFYKDKIQQELREFMAPWAVGEYSKLRFGQCINRSDLIRFLETRDYIDFIIELKMGHEYNRDINYDPILDADLFEICPRTPRSILIGGEIEICISAKDCEKWEYCTDDNEQLIDCCETEIIPVTDYCIEKKPDTDPILT
jgi:hypothetical protein